MVVEGEELLRLLRRRLLEFKNRLALIEAQRKAIGAGVAKLMTPREFTEKYINDKSSDGEEADYTNPRVSTEKYSAH
jgi:hypothetical protein